MAELRVVQVRSAIGTKPKHRGTLRALGLGRIGKTNTLPDRPEIRGMVAKVPHLIEVSEVGSSDTAPAGQGPRLGEEARMGAPAGSSDTAPAGQGAPAGEKASEEAS